MTRTSNVQKVVVHRSGGIGFCGILFITLLLLKVFNVVDWSWWIITVPLWGPLTLLLVVMVTYLIVAALMGLVAKTLHWLDSRARRTRK